MLLDKIILDIDSYLINYGNSYMTPVNQIDCVLVVDMVHINA